MLTNMKSFSTLLVASLTSAAAFAGADWNQWRGPNRNGVLPDSPPLVNSVPADGLKELWNSEMIPSQDDGGLGSAAVAGGKVYLSVVWHSDVPSETRTITDLIMRQIGYQSPNGLGKENVEALEKARTTLPPTMRGKKLEEFTEKWIADHLDKKQKQLYSGLVSGRLKKGNLAIPFPDYEKLQAMVEKPFANQAEFEKWVRAQGFADHVTAQVIEAVPPTKRVAEDTIVCMDLATGKTLWKAKSPGEPKGRNCSSTPAVVDGKVYSLGSTHAYCVDANTGKILWSAQLPGKAPGSSPLVVKGKLIVNAGSLMAFDAATGKSLWTQTKAGGGNASPAAWTSGDKTFVICNGRDLMAADLESGQLAWTAPAGGDSTPAIFGDTLAVQSRSAKLGFVVYKLSPTGAEKLWNHPIDALRTQSSPIIYNGRVYLMDDNVHYCWDLASGKLAWSAPVPSSIASPALADGKIFTLINNGNNLQILKADTNERVELGKANVRGAWVPSPTIADGKLILRTKDRIRCFNLADTGKTPSAVQ